MSTQNKLIAAAAVALVILIFLTLLVQSFFRKKEEETKKITAPTNTYETRRGSSTGIEQNQFEAGRKYATYKKIAKPLSSSENQKVEEAKKKLPFSSDNLNIEYSPFVGQFIVSKKIPDANQKFQDWLGQSGLEDIYKKNPGLFAETDLSLTDYKSLVDKGINDPQNLPDQSRFPVKATTTQKSEAAKQQDKDLKRITDIMRTLFSFDLGEIELTPAPTSEQAAEPNTLCKTAKHCARFVVTSYSANDSGNPRGPCPIYDPSEGKTYHTSGNKGGGCPIDDVTIAVRGEVISPLEHPPVPVCMFYAENPGDPVTAHPKLVQDSGKLGRAHYQIDLFFADSARMNRWGVRENILAAWPSDCTSSK